MVFCKDNTVLPLTIPFSIILSFTFAPVPVLKWGVIPSIVSNTSNPVTTIACFSPVYVISGIVTNVGSKSIVALLITNCFPVNVSGISVFSISL